MSTLPRILFISASDDNWLWLSESAGDRFMLVRESGTFSDIAKRVSLVSPNIAIVDFSPNVGLEPTTIVKELNNLSADLPVVAVGDKSSSDALVEALRAGVKDFLDLTSAPGEIVKTLTNIAQSAPRPKDERLGSAIVVLGARQGAGATTLAVNLAAQLNKEKKDQTLILDFGLPLGDGLIHLPCEEKQGAMDFVECVRSLKRFDATLAKTAFKRHTETGIAVLSLPRNLADLREISASDALKFVNLIKSFFENIVIDLCGFSNTDFVANLLRTADRKLLITNQSVPSVVTAAETLKLLSDKGIRAADFELVINPFMKELALSPESIAQKLGVEAIHLLPARTQPLFAAVNDGKVLSMATPSDAYSKAVADITKKLLTQKPTKGSQTQGDSASVVDKLRGIFKL